MKSTVDQAEEKMVSEKDKYVEKRREQIDKLNTELEDLETRISTADLESKAKLEHEKIIVDLRQKRNEARDKLAEIQAAGDNRWQEIKDGLEGVWTNIKYSIEKAKAKF
jgi:predicted  nucleic acid-binding Zn-ribbon protein